jgi:transposase
MRKIEQIRISAADRERLERLVRDRNTPQKVVWRARIVLLASDGLTAEGIAAAVDKSLLTVRRWRRRFVAKGMDGLLKDATRPSRVKPLAPEKIKQVVHMTLHAKPPNATHWSLRSMAAAAGLSYSSVQRIWRAHGLKPHLVETFKVSRDKNFAAKVEDVVGLYLDPPDRALVFCVDEKSQIQALDRTQPGLPMKKGRAGTMTHDYKRNGTTTLFAALNMLDGKVIGTCMPRHRHREFLRFLRLIDQQTPAGLDLHLIVDNYATHKTPAVKRWLKAHPRFPFALHADFGFLAQHGRALLCRDHPKTYPPRRLQECRRAQKRHHGIPGKTQCRSQAIHLDQVGRPNPRKGRTGETSVRVTTLEAATNYAASKVANRHGSGEVAAKIQAHVIVAVA